MSPKAFASIFGSKSGSRNNAPVLFEPLENRCLLSATLPAGFTETDIGNVGKAGATSYDASTGTFTITGGGNYGTDFFSTADAAHFVYVPITGNGMITAEVESVTANDPTTPSGIAIRDSLSPSASEDFLAVRPDDNLIENVRTTDGATADNLYVSPSVIPQYLRLVRDGNTISSYSSTDGVNFSLDHTDTFASLGATVYAGLVVSSSSPQNTSTAVFDHVTVSSLTATLTNAPTDTLPNASAYQFSITYTSPNNVSAASIGNNNLVVAGPNGYSEDATLVSTSTSSDSATIVANYSVPALSDAGTYTISEGSSPATDTTGAVAADPVGTFYAVTQGQTGQYTITGKVVSSLNPTIGVANRVVYIDANDSGSFVTGDATATTDSSGNFTFSGLLPGTYRVEEELPSGITQSDPVLGYDTASLTPTNPSAAITFSEYPASLAAGTGGPNLTASLINEPNAVIAGSKGKEKITVKNTGTATASGPITISLLLSPTGTLTAQDTVIANLNEKINLKAGKSKTYKLNFIYPSVATDAYHLVAVADSTNAITTTNQANKAAFSNTIEISSAYKELAVTFGTQPAAAPAPGKSSTVTMDVTNIGNANSTDPFTVSLYASTEQTLGTDAVLVGKVSKKGVKANQTKAYKVKFKIPSTLAAGSYYIVSDLTSAVNDNVSASSSTVAVS